MGSPVQLDVGWSWWITCANQNVFVWIYSTFGVDLNEKVDLFLPVQVQVLQNYSVFGVPIFWLLGCVPFALWLLFDVFCFFLLFFLLLLVFFVFPFGIFPGKLSLFFLVLYLRINLLPIFWFLLRLRLQGLYFRILFFQKLTLFVLLLLLTLFFFLSDLLLYLFLLFDDTFALNNSLFCLANIKFLAEIVKKILKGHIILNPGKFGIVSK